MGLFLILPNVLFAATAATSHPASQASQMMHSKTARLFILSGQSNAAGNGNGDELTGADAAIDPEVLIYVGKTQTLSPMAPEVLDKPKEKFNIERLIFGPELSFAKEIKKAFPEDVIVIAKVAVRGGTSIVAWEKDHARAGWRDELRAVANEEAVFLPNGEVRNLYQELIDGTRHAIELLNDRDHVILCGMFWVQNENDGKYEHSARNYKKNLVALIENVRTDLNTPGMPFLFMGVHQEDSPARLILKQMLDEVADEIPATRPWWMPTDWTNTRESISTPKGCLTSGAASPRATWQCRSNHEQSLWSWHAHRYSLSSRGLER